MSFVRSSVCGPVCSGASGVSGVLGVSGVSGVLGVSGASGVSGVSGVPHAAKENKVSIARRIAINFFIMSPLGKFLPIIYRESGLREKSLRNMYT